MNIETAYYVPGGLRTGRVSEEIVSVVNRCMNKDPLFKVTDIGDKKMVIAFTYKLKAYCMKRKIPVRAFQRGLEVFVTRIATEKEDTK